MPTHPDTGEDISNPVYEAIMAERARAEALLRDKEAVSRPRFDQYERAPQPVAAGVPPMMSFMFFVMFLGMMAMGGFIAWQSMSGPAAAPPAPVVVPGGSVDVLVAPIKMKLAYYPDKALATWKAYSGFRDALKKSGERVKNTRDLAYVQSAILSDIDIQPGMTPIGRDIDQAIATQLGITWGRDNADEPEGWEFKSFDDSDRAKLVVIVDAIARAAEAAL